LQRLRDTGRLIDGIDRIHDALDALAFPHEVIDP
jgi:hypothetical protein